MANQTQGQSAQLYQLIQKLVGLHRQLLETVRLERESLVQADLKGIQETTSAKQALIQSIHQVESERVKLVAQLAIIWKKPVRDLTLPNIIIQVQGADLKAADQLRSAYNALTILIQRISEQNKYNQGLVEKSLEHVHEMKRNILGETVPNSSTYTAQGQKSGGVSGARLISKEA